MIEQYIQVIRVKQCVFRRLPKEIRRMRDDKLIDRRAGSHHYRQRRALPAPRAPGLLPGAGDGARISAQHAGGQRANIHAQLQRIGGNDRIDAARAQPLFNLAALDVYKRQG